MQFVACPPPRSGAEGSGRRPGTEGVALPPRSSAAPPTAPLQAVEQTKARKRIEKTAQDFEAAFLGQMLKGMFEGVETSAPFGGGPGEAAFKSFLTEAVAKQMAAGGGVGLADDLQRQMLKMQGLE